MVQGNAIRAARGDVAGIDQPGVDEQDDVGAVVGRQQQHIVAAVVVEDVLRAGR